MDFLNEKLKCLSLVFEQSLSVYIIGVIVSVSVYFIFLTIYRLTIHPLAKYPGDLIDIISNWSLIYHCYVGDRHLWTYALHQKYGPIVRTGPNMLSFNTASAIAALHTDRHANVRKSDWYKLEPAESGAHSLQTVIDKKQHAWRRRVISPAFSTKALREQEEFIIENVEILLHQLRNEVEADGWSKPKDISTWSTYYGFDFISDISFGSRFGLLESADHRYIPDLLMSTSKFIYYAAFLPCLSILCLIVGTPLKHLIPNQAAQDTNKFFEVSLNKMVEREAKESSTVKAETGKTGRKDLFHYLFHSKDPKTGFGFTQEQLHADSFLFIAAGADGVAVTISAAVFYLLKNPDTLQKLTQELRTCFGSIDSITSPKLNELSYLNAVVDETVRICPGAPSAFPRTTLEGGVIVDGVHIPAGIDVGVSPYSTHHNEAHFPDSFTFKPERWLNREDDEIKVMKSAVFTFGSGPYNCIGKALAILATKMVLARMLFKFDMKAPDVTVIGGGAPSKVHGRQRHDEYQLIDWIVGYRTGPKIQLRLASS